MVRSLVSVQKYCLVQKNTGSSISCAVIPLKSTVLFLIFYQVVWGSMCTCFIQVLSYYFRESTVSCSYNGAESTGKFSCRQPSYLDGSCNFMESILQKKSIVTNKLAHAISL